MDQGQKFKEEIDFRDLLRHPHKMFGYAYIYFAIAVIGLGWLYISHLNAIGRNAIPSSVFADSAARVTDIPLQNPRQIPPVDVRKAGLSSPEYISRGRDLYKANCASCHGDNGEGNGPAGLMLNPKPRNFLSLSGWTNGSKVTQMYKTLEEGIVRNGMASYSYMPPEDRFAMIHYVRTFAAGQPIDSEDDLKQLETAYQLSKGMNVPGRVPLRKASQLVVRESDSLVRNVSAAVSKASTASSEAAKIFRSVASNQGRIFTSLYRNPHALSAPDTLAAIVAANPDEMGFRKNVLRLSREEWTQLHAFLNDVQ